MTKMKNWWKWINENKIASTVIGGLILAGLLKLLDIIFSLNIFPSIIELAIKKYTIPFWGLAIIGFSPLVIAAGIMLTMILLDNKPKGVSLAEPRWKLYTEDIIFSIHWQWKYILNAIDRHSLLALCPKCKRQLKTHSTSIYGISSGNYKFCMDCPNCSFRSNEFKGDFFELIQSVLTEIEGRIRNDEYKEKIYDGHH